MAIENLIQNLKDESSEELGLALNEARGLIKKYVVLESEEYFDALTLWIASTYTQEAFQYFPRVVFSSPDKQCGKTTALTIVEFLVEKPQRTSSISVSALFRTIEAKRDEGVVLLMDEIDSTFSKNGDKERGEATRQIINEGFIKNGVVHRTEGKNFVVKEFRVACPIVMAGIGKTASPETIRDRSLIFPMRRVLPNERLGLGRLRHKWAELEFAPVRERLAKSLINTLFVLRAFGNNITAHSPKINSGHTIDAYRVLNWFAFISVIQMTTARRRSDRVSVSWKILTNLLKLNTKYVRGVFDTV